VSHWSLII
jgi:elongation factor 1-gamma